jgi:hypothetical protein
MAAYTKYQLQKVYDEIAVERPHRCNCCSTPDRLSHSHLVPKGQNGALAVVKENIVYHCLGTPTFIGCHATYESMGVAKMADFEENYRIIFKLDPRYFWLKIHKLHDYYMSKDIETFRRIRALMTSIDNHPTRKTI